MPTELLTTPSAMSSDASASRVQGACRLDLAVVLPPYNERENIAEVIGRIELVLKDYVGS
jgi:hypothetical protein